MIILTGMPQYVRFSESMALPTVKQRIDSCCRPKDRQPVMYQKWRELLFLHWEVDPDEIQRTLPDGLTVDTYHGKAFLGLVPFFMKDIRPRFLPAVPGISNFLEMNLRTYVYDKLGRPGVWFYSLDANQWLAVRVARTFFNLPYFDAVMSTETNDGISYRVSRKGASSHLDSNFYYKKLEKLDPPDPESLEFFLIERYLLFAVNKLSNSLYSGQVHHEPYPLYNVDALIKSAGAIELAGFSALNRLPDHTIMSPGVDVDVFSIEKIS